LPADVLNDLSNIISGIEHHGIMGPQFYGIPEPVSLGHFMLNRFSLLVFDIKIGPRGYGDQED
jgi:hypothetical protein